MLGRRNCQQFLRRHFALPSDAAADVKNPLFAQWPESERDAFAFLKDYRFPDGTVRSIQHLPIIPLLGKLSSSDYTRTPPWPEAPADLKLDDLRVGILARAEAVKDAAIRDLEAGFMVRMAIKVAWAWKRKEWVQTLAIDTLTKALGKRGHRIS